MLYFTGWRLEFKLLSHNNNANSGCRLIFLEYIWFKFRDFLFILQEEQMCPSGRGGLACSYCTRVFTNYSALRQHLPVHTGEKNYECVHCGRKFTQSSSLNKHLKRFTCAALKP